MSEFATQRAVAIVADLLSQSISRACDRLENNCSGDPTSEWLSFTNVPNIIKTKKVTKSVLMCSPINFWLTDNFLKRSNSVPYFTVDAFRGWYDCRTY
jgi:hypothetical protein